MAFLENHEVLSCNDLHEMRDILNRVTCTDEIDVIGEGHEIEASLRSAAFSDMNLMHVTYGDVPTRVQTYDSDQDTLLLFVLTGGTAQVRHNGEEFDISATTGLIRSLRLPLSAVQDAFASFVLPLSVGTLKQHAAVLLGEDAHGLDISFDAMVDLTAFGGQYLRETVHYLARSLDGPLHGAESPIVQERLKDLVLSSVLSLLPNSLSNRLQDRPSAGIVPYYVKRARDYIHAHAASPITLKALATHAGCSYRTLQVAFKEAYGMSPMAYVRVARLNLAHEDLRCAEAGTTVRDVALKWGFTNMGWFANCYMKQFGTLPSQTLRVRA